MYGGGGEGYREKGRGVPGQGVSGVWGRGVPGEEVGCTVEGCGV